MTNKFTSLSGLEDLKSAFPIDEIKIAPIDSQSIQPSQAVLAIVHEKGKNSLKRFHWGLVPPWADNTRKGTQLINARAETVAIKPSFRNAFKQRRCLIPALGFFEYKGKQANQQAFYFTRPDKRPLGFAGIWECWHGQGHTNAPYLSCTLITTAAGRSVKPIHHRMPVILHPNNYATWLDPANHDSEALQSMLRIDIIDDLMARPVSTRSCGIGDDGTHTVFPMFQMQLDFE